PLRMRSSVRVPLTPPHANWETRPPRRQPTDFAKVLPSFGASPLRSFRSAEDSERSYRKLYHTILQDRHLNFVETFEPLKRRPPSSPRVRDYGELGEAAGE